MNLVRQEIQSTAKQVDQYLKSYFKAHKNNTRLYEAMRYGLFSGGKKIRSFLIKSSFKLFNLSPKLFLPVAAAVECVHSYSLIHDDLPAMDNDNYRRGKLSTHKKFGEFTAILAGNALLTTAFEILSSSKNSFTNSIKNNLIHALANSSGHQGIAGGQYLDLTYAKGKQKKYNVIHMQNKKTGELMGFCTQSAAIVANKNKLEKKLKEIGIKLGLIFQITDDLLDLYGDKKKLGKPTRQDRLKGKKTLIGLLGKDKAMNLSYDLFSEIQKDLKIFGNKANSLIKCASFLLERDY